MTLYEEFQKKVDDSCNEAIKNPTEENISKYRKIQKSFNEFKDCAVIENDYSSINN